MNELATMLQLARAAFGSGLLPFGIGDSATRDAATTRLRSLSDGSIDPNTFGSDPLDKTITPTDLGTLVFLDELVRKTRLLVLPRTYPPGWDFAAATEHQDVTNAQNVASTALQFPVVSGTGYAVEMFLVYSGNNATGDFSFRFAVTAGTMTGAGAVYGDNASDALANTRITAAAAATTGIITLGTAASLTDPRVATAQFAFRQAGSNGTFRVEFGNGAPSGGRTSRVGAGSYLRFRAI